MHVTRINEALSYAPPNHHGVEAARLQGLDASPAEKLWVGLSIFAPGGSADHGSSPSEKIYVVLEGEVTVIFAEQAVTLAAMDSILIEANEPRSVENRSAHPSRMLVISPR